MTRAARVLSVALAAGIVAACNLTPAPATTPAVGTYTPKRFMIDVGGGATTSEFGAAVTASFFKDSKVSPMLGRAFVEGDTPQSVVIFSHGLWSQRFQADPSVVGKEVLIDDQRMTVVGVMPTSFQFPENARLWVKR
jgi:hypothetical protein